MAESVKTAGARNIVILPDLVAEGPLLPPPPGWQEMRVSGETMGTDWVLSAYAPPGSAPGLREIVETVCAYIIALFSPWTAASEVSALHRDPRETVTISTGFRDLLAPLLDLAQQTGGASDPCLGALSDLWGFGPPGPRDPRQPLPQASEIAAATALSGSQRIRLEDHQLTRPPGLRFDFSGSAKGLAVDEVSAALTKAGFGFHLIGIGGEYYGRGLRANMQPWWVEVEQPADLPRILVALNGHGIASSGDWRRFFRHDGQHYAHTIDPATGAPVQNDIAAVSVIADSVMRADALATALLVKGAQEGMAFAQDARVAAVVIRRDGECGHRALFSPEMARMRDDDAQR